MENLKAYLERKRRIQDAKGLLNTDVHVESERGDFKGLLFLVGLSGINLIHKEKSGTVGTILYWQDIRKISPLTNVVNLAAERVRRAVPS